MLSLRVESSLPSAHPARGVVTADIPGEKSEVVVSWQSRGGVLASFGNGGGIRSLMFSPPCEGWCWPGFGSALGGLSQMWGLGAISSGVPAVDGVVARKSVPGSCYPYEQ